MAIKRMLVVCAYKDGRIDQYTVTPAVEMYFERVYKVGMRNAFDGEGGFSNIVRLGWEAMRANSGGAVVPDCDTWAGMLEAVDIETEAIAPFVAGVGGRPSPPSPPPPA